MGVFWPPHGHSVRTYAKSQLRRTADGKLIRKFPLASNIATPVWSPDERWLAFPSRWYLVVAGTQDGRLKTVWEGDVGSVAWTKAGLLRYVSLPDEVWQYDPVGGERKLLLRLGFTLSQFFKDHGELAARSRISRSGRLVAAVTGSKIVFFDLDRAQPIRSIPNPAWRERDGLNLTGHLTWSNSERRCRFTHLADDGRHLTLYDLDQNTRVDLGSRLVPDGRADRWLSFALEEDCWSADDRFFIAQVLSRDTRHYICQLEPWSAVCLEDQFGGRLRTEKLSPGAEFIAFTREFENVGIFVAALQTNVNGALRLGPAARVWSSGRANWFWSPRQPQLLVSQEDKFVTAFDGRH
jgi:hypothetical protein